MRRIVLMLLFIGINQFVSGQAIEVLDDHIFSEIEVKDKFLFFQDLTVKNTCNGVDDIDEVNAEKIFATKSLYQLMYWRYSDLDFDKNKGIASVGNVSSSKTEENFTDLGRKLSAMGIIKSFIFE